MTDIYCRDCGETGHTDQFEMITELEVKEHFFAGDIDHDEYVEALEYSVGRYMCGCGTLMSPVAS